MEHMRIELVDATSYKIYTIELTFWADKLGYLSVNFIDSGNRIVYDYDDFKKEEKVIVVNCEMLTCFILSSSDVEKINMFFDVLQEMVCDSIFVREEK